MRRGDNQGIAHHDLRIFAISEHTPAVAEEPVTIRVKEVSDRAWGACTQRGRELGVIHGGKVIAIACAQPAIQQNERLNQYFFLSARKRINALRC